LAEGNGLLKPGDRSGHVQNAGWIVKIRSARFEKDPGLFRAVHASGDQTTSQDFRTAQGLANRCGGIWLSDLESP
jgi:hypothetical protein